MTKYLIKFFEWLYFKEPGFNGKKTKIIRIKGINTFLIDRDCHRETASPVWDKDRFKYLYNRFARRKNDL